MARRKSKRVKASGRGVRESIERFYERKKHLTKKKARYIAGAVAHKEMHILRRKSKSKRRR